MAAAHAVEPFSIRGFASRMRTVDASKCWPFGGGGDGEPPLPPMEPPKRSRWWAHELPAERARLEALTARAEDAEGGYEEGGGFGKGTKRKGTSERVRAERARKRRRAVLLLKRKLLRKHKDSTIHIQRELSARKKFQDAHNRMSTHENSPGEQYIRGRDPSIDVSSKLFMKKAANSFVKIQNIKASEPATYPRSPVCELVKNVACPPNDDIFGDLPLLESSKIMFRTGVDELPTVIEDSFVTDQSGPDAISEIVPLKLIPSSDVSAQTPSNLEFLVKKEGTPGNNSTCISYNDAKKSHPSAEFDGPLNHSSVNMVKTCLSDTQQKPTHVPALCSYSKERLKPGSSYTLDGCFSMNRNHHQEIKKPGTSSTKSSVAVRSRMEATERDKDMVVNGKKSTNISCPMVRNEYHISSEDSILSSAISQGSPSAGSNVDGMSSCKRLTSHDSIVTSSLIDNFASNVCHESRKSVDTCTSISKEDKGSWFTKPHPVSAPASIGLAFMKLPGLERIEISSCNLRTDENKIMNGWPANTVRCEKQQLVSGVPNIMQGQRNTGFTNSHVREKVLDGYVTRQDVYHLCQPTVRLMGKTVSVYEHSKEHRVSTLGKVWTDNTVFQDRPSSSSCHLPQKRLFPCQDSVIPRTYLKESPDILPRIPNRTVSESRATVGNVQIQSMQPTDSVSSMVRDCIWTYGCQSVCQAGVKKVCTMNANSRARHLDVHQPAEVISLSQNEHCQLNPPASNLRGEVCNFLGPAVTPSSVPQWVPNICMQQKYQKPTMFSYDDPSSVPIRQSCQVPGAKLSSASIISFLDYGTNNAEFSKSLPPPCPSLTTSLPSNFLSTVNPTCTVNTANIGYRKSVAFTNQRNKRHTYADNVAHEPAKKLVANTQDLMTPMFSDVKNHSLGWSLDDAIGPRILDFSSKVAGHGTEISTKESNISRVSSGPAPDFETRSRTVRLVAGAKTMLKPGPNLNDHSKVLYSTKLSVDNGVNSALL
ncbi:hypothetical protein GUJ93_ZPchr0007g3310 [Zizania palustris]|uniref:Uncharacterized protein n=1 Tax=Zizania palustris TaxID=103762 RepID=A0A8J5VMR8_ZIZPA|nr:hypothetical protein GUJ93_ZPchr0007g3310 [Zizania palustris]